MTAPPVTGAGSGDAAVVLGAFGALGVRVPDAEPPDLAAAGPQTLWLVEDGAVDLFAVDTAGPGHWHFLGRLGPGTLLLGPAGGPRHTLVARPLRGCALRRVGLRELPWPVGGGRPAAGTGTEYPGALEYAFALGVGRALGTLFAGPLGDGPVADDGVAEGGAGDAVLWTEVPPGAVAYGTDPAGGTAGELLVDAGLWRRMVDQQRRLLTALDRWIEELERGHEDRAAAGVRAGEAVRAEADRTLVDALADGAAPTRERRRPRGPGGTDAAYAAVRAVGAAAGITIAQPRPGTGPDDRTDPVERIARDSGVRTRRVRLDGRWWRRDMGPLVGFRSAGGTPVALLWRRGGYEAAGAGPGRGVRVGARDAGEFEDRAVMLYRPLPDRPLGPLGLLRFCLRGSGADLRRLALCAVVTVVLGALVPIATGHVLGVLVPAGDRAAIGRLCLAVIAGGVVTAAFLLTQNLTVLRLEGRIESVLQPAVWDRLLRLPTGFFARRATGELAGAALGVGTIRRLLSGVGPVLVQAGTLGAANVVLLWVYGGPLAPVALGALVVIACSFLGLGLWQLRWQRRLVTLGNKLGDRAYQTLRGLPKLRVAAAEDYAYAAWAREFARSRELQRRVGRIRNVSAVLGALYLPVCTLVMFALLAGPARGSMPAGDFLTFSTALTLTLMSATQLTGALVSVAAAWPVFEEIRPVLDARPEVGAGRVRPGVLAGAVEARDLSFRYTDEGPPVLDGVSFAVRPGEFVAVVGPSGCGKSTLLRLLIGFDRPLSGSVLYDGQDLAALDAAAVRRQCGVVLQDAQPFTGSVLDCVRGTEAFSVEEAWEAATMAGLADDIRRMPMGMHTMVAGPGTVSGGQRQRLMIARALIRRPRVLFLDEATSALDNATQRVVIDSTRALNATRLVIAHRLSTVLDADRVLVMDGGRIVAEGPPSVLLADTGGPLRELVREQWGDG
ncbi:NHLP bacteriocin export ABC transporter permease/ATPase subunit [Streptomyces uncialis]|uniref:NHLP bacteriocin export ABC transporter permease/ATPase subunit n=1 Tax=Streptomyces uncialis TaxID=1048205 RepID=UPI00340B74E7